MSTSTPLRALATALLATFAVAASAAPIYLIDATTDGLAPDAGLTNVAFSLTYEDTNQDTLFSLGELLAFTGVADGASNFFDTLTAVPLLTGIAGSGGDWVFSDSNGALADYRAAAAMFTPFTTGPLPGSVPEPASLALALTALAGLGFARRAR